MARRDFEGLERRRMRAARLFDQGEIQGAVAGRLRGLIDLLAGGVGMRRGRPDPEPLRVGDTVDWWRVKAFEPDRRLRLRAEMKLPGRAWLECEVRPCAQGSRIQQTALFDPAALRPIATLALTLVCAFAVPAEASELARADALWARRAEGQVDAVARTEPVRGAIEAYERALAADPERLEAHWKLQRALWFAADFASSGPAEERHTYEQAQEAAERAFAVLVRRVGGREALDGMSPEALRDALPTVARRDAGELYFWHAVNLGAWSRIAGLLQAVRAGVAGRVHEATLRSIALDPGVEQGGAIRLLSRLHSELPRIPLLSGWVDHEQAIPLAERAVNEYPKHPGNAYLLGLAILSNAPTRFDEGLALIEVTASLEPRSDHLVEDLAIQIDARKRLEQQPRASQ